MDSNKKKKIIIGSTLVALLLFVVISVGTYAKYVASLGEKQSTANIATWAFENENSASELTFDLLGTYNSDSLVSGKVAPGTNGKFEVSLSNTQSDVGVAYTIKFDNDTLGYVKLYSDSARQNELSKDNGDYIYTGYLKQGQSAKTVTVYWEWTYYVSDAQDELDSQVGEAQLGEGISPISATITAYQVNPTDSTISYPAD